MAIVVSASRRTDIPAFYMDGVMASVRAGFFQTVNPFNGRRRMVPCGPQEVAAIVFWSKDFGAFLGKGYGQALVDMGYRLLFNFTVNGPDTLLEAHLPPLEVRLDQMGELCRVFGSEAIQWRFDPICFYRNGGGPVRDNLAGLHGIAQSAAACGVKSCVTSFTDTYAKAAKRFAAAGCRLIDPPLTEKIGVIETMASLLAGLGIVLDLCCEPEVLAGLAPGSGVGQSRCISHERINRLFGADLSGSPDRGQRRSKGCGCHVAVDVGDYRHQPCRHRCLYCYANSA